MLRHRNHICQYCGKEFINGHTSKPNKFCCKKCHGLSLRGKSHSWGNKISKTRKGHGWPDGYHERQSIAQKKRFEAQSVWNKGMGGETKRKRQTELEWAKNRAWREAVFKRDNFTCVKCGARNGLGKDVNLNADHIKMWAFYPKLRYELSNGQTLCSICHRGKTAIELRIYWKNQFSMSREAVCA